MIINKENYTMAHIELNKKVQPKVNKKELEEVHSIRGAYQLSCGTCVYHEYCAKMGYTKTNFYERIDAQ